MLHDLQGVLEVAAQESPLALVLDDLQWADAGTLAAVTMLPSRLSGTAILWVLAIRSRERRAAIRDAITTLERGGARRLALRALSDDTVAVIVADTVEAEADRALLKLAANARGNPFLLVELLRGLREEGRLGEADGRAFVVGDGLPRRLTDSMRERLERLSDEAQRAVTVADALGPRFTAEQLAAMLELRPSSLVTVVAETLNADFLVEAGDRLSFRHDLVREAVLESVPRSVRRALAREAATVLLVESWALAGSSVRLKAGQLADARAEAQSSTITPEQIAAGDVAGATAMLTLAEVALHTGESDLLKSSVDAARVAFDSGSPPVCRHAMWVMVLAAIARSDWTDAVRWLYDESMPYTSPVVPRDPGYQPLVARVALSAGDPGLAERALEFAETFDRESPGVPVLSAAAAHTRGLVAGDTAELLDAAQALRATERPLLFASASENAGRALAHDGHIHDAVNRLTDALDTYLEFEAGADARRVSRTLREHGEHRPVPARPRPRSGWESLTESELRVARLVAQGATNRDAADQLFLSPHTVSTHLRHSFSKLGINSRVELARIAFKEDTLTIEPK